MPSRQGSLSYSAHCATHRVPGSSPINVCFFFHVEVRSAAMLAVKRSAGVTLEVNLRNPLHTGNETCKQEILPDLETPEQTLPDVQNKGSSGPTKRTYVLKRFSKKSSTMV